MSYVFNGAYKDVQRAAITKLVTPTAIRNYFRHISAFFRFGLALYLLTVL